MVATSQVGLHFGVIDKGNIVVFDGSGSFILPNTCAGVASVRKAITRVGGRNPLHANNGVFVLRTWDPEDTSPTGFSRRCLARKGLDHPYDH